MSDSKNPLIKACKATAKIIKGIANIGNNKQSAINTPINKPKSTIMLLAFDLDF